MYHSLRTVEGLKQVLQARSYKNEIILLTFTLSVLDQGLQVYSAFKKLGLGNTIMLTPSEEVRGICDPPP